MEPTIVGGHARQLLPDADPRTDPDAGFLTKSGTDRTQTSSAAAARLRAVVGSSVGPAADTDAVAAFSSSSSRNLRRRNRPVLNASERLGRGAALLLFLTMVILAGVFIEASFTGGAMKSSSPAQPSISVPTPRDPNGPVTDTAVIGNRRPSEAAAPQAPAAAPTAAPPQPISAHPMRGAAPTPVSPPAGSSSPFVPPIVVASPPRPPSAPAVPMQGVDTRPDTAPPARSPMAAAPASRAAEPSAAPKTPPDQATEVAGSTLTATEIQSLLSRGDASLRAGDVTSARVMYQRSALAGDKTAALRLAQAFDPVFLDRAHFRSERGDLGMAVFWYRRALELGSAEAGVFLRRTEIAARSQWNAAVSSPNRNHFPAQFMPGMRRTNAASP